VPVFPLAVTALVVADAALTFKDERVPMSANARRARKATAPDAG
jgi:hypothetical protein